MPLVSSRIAFCLIFGSMDTRKFYCISDRTDGIGIANVLRFLGWFVPEDRFQFQKFFQARFAPLAAISRLLVAAEAAVESGSGPVDMHVAGANAFSYAAGVIHIAGCNVSRPAIGRSFRHRDYTLSTLVGSPA